MEWKPIANNYSYIKITIYMIIIFESFNYLIKTIIGVHFTAIPILLKMGIFLIVIPIHEFIHFIVGYIFVQDKGKVHFGFIFNMFSFYANVDGIYKRCGFICYIIAPFLLSGALSAICIYYNFMNEIIWQFIFYNIVASTVDILNFINTMFRFRDISYFKLEEFKLFGSELDNLNIRINKN